MYTLLLAVFVVFIVVAMGAALLGWVGKFSAATAALAMSVVGMLATGLLAKTLDASGSGIPTLFGAIGAGAVLLGFCVAVLARQGHKGSADPEPDYVAIGRERLAELDSVVAANKAARGLK